LPGRARPSQLISVFGGLEWERRLNSEGADSIVVAEHECWECWNAFRVRSRARAQRRQPLGLRVTIELPCPYCARENEFDARVIGVEPLDIRTPRRRLKNLARRLVNAGGDMLVRMHDLQRVVSNYERILHKAWTPGPHPPRP